MAPKIHLSFFLSFLLYEKAQCVIVRVFSCTRVGTRVCACMCVCACLLREKLTVFPGWWFLLGQETVESESHHSGNCSQPGRYRCQRVQPRQQTHTNKHTHTHLHTDTRTQAHILTHACTRTHTHTHTQTQTQADTHRHTQRACLTAHCSHQTSLQHQHRLFWLSHKAS